MAGSGRPLPPPPPPVARKGSGELEAFGDALSAAVGKMDGGVEAQDDNIGRMLETLRKEKLEEDTLIFFLSDNGGPTKRNGSRNDPFRGFKGDVTPKS